MKREPASFTLELGEKAPYFSLPATDGKIYSLSDFVGSRALVVVFTCNHCPYARAYEERICELVEKFKSQGVNFVAICSNDAEDYPEDGFQQMKEKSKAWGFSFPYLHDESQVMARAYDAACTPEAFVFNGNMQLVYHGWIDDNHQNREQVRYHDLAVAIESTIHGETPTRQLTPVLGCSIKWRK